MKTKLLAILALLAIVLVAMPSAMAVPVQAVNTTAIDEMADTIVALLVAIIPILLILAIWGRIKGVWVVIPLTVLAVNTTAITDMADTIIALLVAIIPILLILGIWMRFKRGV
jgi:hypothetical protein